MAGKNCVGICRWVYLYSVLSAISTDESDPCPQRLASRRPGTNRGDELQERRFSPFAFRCSWACSLLGTLCYNNRCFQSRRSCMSAWRVWPRTCWVCSSCWPSRPTSTPCKNTERSSQNHFLLCYPPYYTKRGNAVFYFLLVKLYSNLYRVTDSALGSASQLLQD